MHKILRASIVKYFVISLGASFIDFFIAYYLYRILSVDYLVACNAGILSGFLFQYFACKQFIFENKNFTGSLLVYIITFLIGFFLADITMWASYGRLRFSFLLSKALSMMVPFFITYFIRKNLLGLRSSGGKI